VHKNQRLPKNLSGSHWTQIGLKIWLEILIFFCMDSTDTKHGLVEVESAAQVLWNLFSTSGAQSRTQCFKQRSERNPNGPETDFESKLCRLLWWSDSESHFEL